MQLENVGVRHRTAVSVKNTDIQQEEGMTDMILSKNPQKVLPLMKWLANISLNVAQSQRTKRNGIIGRFIQSGTICGSLMDIISIKQSYAKNKTKGWTHSSLGRKMAFYRVGLCGCTLCRSGTKCHLTETNDCKEWVEQI